MLRLGCADYSFPALDAAGQVALCRLLGFTSASTSLFLETEAEILAFEAHPDGWAEARLDALGDTRVDDLFLILRGGDFDGGAINSADAGWRDRARRVFELSLGAARAIAAPAVTILPGTPWPSDRRSGWAMAAAELRDRVAAASQVGLRVQIEPNLGSIASTPELVLDLLDAVPGLGLVLDASHFVVQSIPMRRIVPLAAHTTQVHLRAARPGEIQVAWHRNETDFVTLFAALHAANYGGPVTIEYTPMQQWRCDRMDVLSAVAETRDAVTPLLAA